MKMQKVFILLVSLVASYSLLEAVSQQEVLIAKLDAKDQSIHLQELAKEQEAEKAEQQRIANQEERKVDRLKKQEKQEQMKLIRNLETDEDHFMVDSIPIPKEGE
ncbi:MAG: hypothetical protein LBC45_00045 [Chlamydiales bacterium]|jgi:hypothetical protein|nr:hypothetical protein [Chlamydiales bacterium]